MSDPIVIYEKRGHVALITLNDPARMNALSQAMRGALVTALDRAGTDKDIRAVVLTGAGERAFTAGLDLGEISADPSVLTEAVNPDSDINPVAAIRRLACPVIAAVNGYAITGGLELMLACDFHIAADTARFGDTHAAVGVLPGWGLSQTLSRLIGPARACEMHFTARLIDAPTAEAWGLVNRVAPAADLLSEALETAAACAAHPPQNLAAYKRLVTDGYELPFGQAMALEAACSRENYATAKPRNLVRE